MAQAARNPGAQTALPRLPGRIQASEPQELDVVAGGPIEREVGDDLADDGAELEAVAREAGCDDGGRALRMQVDEEMLVRAILEQACLEREGRSRAGREVALDEGAEQGLVLRMGRAVQLVG